MHPRIPLAFLAARAHCWLMINLLSSRTSRSLSAELLSNRSAPSLYWCMGLLLPRCRTLHLPLLNFIMLYDIYIKCVYLCRYICRHTCLNIRIISILNLCHLSNSDPTVFKLQILIQVNKHFSSTIIQKGLKYSLKAETVPVQHRWELVVSVCPSHVVCTDSRRLCTLCLHTIHCFISRFADLTPDFLFAV